MRLGLRPGQFNNAWRMRFSARNMPRGDRFESACAGSWSINACNLAASWLKAAIPARYCFFIPIDPWVNPQ